MSELDLDNINLSELYNEPEDLRIEEQDARILKAIITDTKSARYFSNIYDDSLFVGNAKLFAKSVIDYFKTYKALPTKRVLLDINQNNPVFCNEIEYIYNKLDNLDYNISDFQYDLTKVKNRFIQKEVVSLKNSVEQIDFNSVDYDTVIRNLRSKISLVEKIKQGKKEAYKQKTLKEYLPTFREDFIKKSKDPTVGRGILTGYSYLDYITNGLQEAELLIISAETGGGKSLMLNNMAIQIWMQQNAIGQTSPWTKGYNILFFSLEMPFEQCFRRTLSRLAEVSTYALRDCQITERAQLEKLRDTSKFIKNYPFEFEIVDVPRGVTIEEIEERYLESIDKGFVPDVVFVDYLGLMETSQQFSEDWLKLGYISAQLHEFGRVYNVPVCTAVQLNRPKNPKDPSETIGIHRIGRSALIMTNASIAIQIEKRIDEETFPDMPYHIIKNRHGECGKHHLKKLFAKSTLIDFEPYVPIINDGEFKPVVNSIDDISNYLEKLGWD